MTTCDFFGRLHGRSFWNDLRQRSLVEIVLVQERRRHTEHRSQVGIIEVLGFSTIGQLMDVHHGLAGQGGSDEAGSLPTRGVAVEQELDDGSMSEPRRLVIGHLSSEERHSTRYASLGEAHDGPWALDDDDAMLTIRPGPVGAEETGGLGKLAWEEPLSKPGDLFRVQSSPAVAEGAAGEVMEADGYSSLQEGATCWRAGLETASGVHRDPLGPLQEGHFGVEGDRAFEGGEGFFSHRRFW